jgi:diacylglycerol kinase (ATP)
MDLDKEKVKNSNIPEDIKVYDIKTHNTKEPPKRISLTRSFNYAIEGIIHTLKNERNMKIHYLGAVFVLLAALFFDFSKLELIALFFCISLVIICEMINTAIESVVDLLTEVYNEKAKVAKDVAAGAVLIAAATSVVTGYLLFIGKIGPHFNNFMLKIRQTPTHATFIILAIVVILTIVIKTIYGGGTPMAGGMPSGHTALGFAAATIIALNKSDVLTATLCYFMAFLLAQSRVEGKIHSVFETFIGAILGFLTALLIYGLFRS